MKGVRTIKRSELYWGLGYSLAGLIFLVLGLSTHTALDAVLFGLAGACIGPGAVIIFKYFYWTRPGKREEYARMAEQEKIDLEDELKASLRDKSGRYAYLVWLLLISLSMLVFTVLDALEVLDARVIIFYLAGFLVFQFAAGNAIYQWLLKKYD